VISSGDREHLVQLVRDEQDGEPFGLELAQVAEQLVDLLRHQHRGGLVQDEDAGPAVEHLEDFDPLPVPDPRSSTIRSGRMSNPYAAEISRIRRLAAAKSSTPSRPAPRRAPRSPGP